MKPQEKKVLFEALLALRTDIQTLRNEIRELKSNNNQQSNQYRSHNNADDNLTEKYQSKQKSFKPAGLFSTLSDLNVEPYHPDELNETAYAGNLPKVNAESILDNVEKTGQDDLWSKILDPNRNKAFIDKMNKTGQDFFK